MYCNDVIKKLREVSPVIHHMTNFVTANDCANIVLALGASPIMALCESEIEEIVSISSALVLNIGTLQLNQLESMLTAGRKAKLLKKPIIFDPVGCGASLYRNNAARSIIKIVRPDIIKGNISEIKNLIQYKGSMKGVDSDENMEDASFIAKTLSVKTNAIVIITGKTDYVSDGKHVVHIDNGTSMMSRITGTGCMLNSVTACFTCVCENYLEAAVLSTATMGICGEIAQKNLSASEGTGTFRQKLIDAASLIKDSDINEKGVIFFENN